MRQFVVFGLGRFGFETATRLSELGAEVIAVDREMRLVEQIKDLVAQAVCMDCTDEAALRSLGIEDVDAAVVAIGDSIEVNILTAAILRDLGVKRIVARAASPLHGRILQRIGVHQVIYPEIQIAQQVARGLMGPGVLSYIMLAEEQSLVELPAPEGLIGKTIADTNFRKRHNLMIIGIRRGEGCFVSLPGPEEQLEEGDVLMVVGKDEDIERFLKKAGGG
ncbi:MAG TPA: TrkA family potassium uptake protein [Candidatus Latescibacteria bacterium]|nr:TrkA family potassium uptake protein [Candidatus Latescibacterota bacterium]